MLLLSSVNRKKKFWDILKNIYERMKQAQDKKLITKLNGFNNFKSLPSETIDDSFKRISLIIIRLSNGFHKLLTKLTMEGYDVYDQPKQEIIPKVTHIVI